MTCDECVILADDLRRREREYSNAARFLANPVRFENVRQYRILLAGAEEFRSNYRLARRVLEEHRRVHSEAN